MKLLTKAIRAKLVANGRIQEPVRGTDREIDFRPVVKLFNPSGAGTWLLTEIDPADEDIAFRLCDLGAGCPRSGASAFPSWPPSVAVSASASSATCT